MTEIFRTRDCVVHFKGDAFPVMVSPAMMRQGWPGSQGVQWVDAPIDEFQVGYSDGLYGGFLLWGSDEVSDQYTALTGSQPKYGYSVLCTGGWLMSTSTYERYTYASRLAGPPYVPIPYSAGLRVRFSLRGFWTIEDEWFLSGDPRGTNGYYIGSVVEPPSVKTNNYLVLQTSI